MKDNLLQLHANDNHIGAGFSFDNHSENETKGELIINGKVSKEEDSKIFDIKIMPSSLHYNSKQWNIQPSNLRMQDGNISVDSFGAISDEQSISLDGKISDSHGDLLTLYVERFDLSMINALLPRDFGIKGAVSGMASIASPINEKDLTVDMVCDSSYIADRPIGTLKLGTKGNRSNNCFDFHINNLLSEKKNIDVSGNLFTEPKSITAKANLDHLEVGYAQPFLSDIFSEMQGSISGNIFIDGPLDRMSIGSKNTRLNNTTLKIAYTGVPYMADGRFHLDDSGVYFDDIAIKDRFDGHGKVTGSINYDHFRDITFDTHIRVNEIEAVDLGENESESFYGNLFGTGDIAITGPISALTMSVNAETAKSGNLHIPISSSISSAKGTNLLKFKEIDISDEVDPYDIFVQKTDNEGKESNSFIVKLNVAAINLELTKHICYLAIGWARITHDHDTLFVIAIRINDTLEHIRQHNGFKLITGN